MERLFDLINSLEPKQFRLLVGPVYLLFFLFLIWATKKFEDSKFKQYKEAENDQQIHYLTGRWVRFVRWLLMGMTILATITILCQ